MSHTLFFVCNSSGALARFRLPIISAALRSGYKVHCVCGNGVEPMKYIQILREAGTAVQVIPGLDATSMNPLALRQESIALAALLDQISPDIVHAFTHRANIVSYLALRARPKIRFIPNFTGAGRLFEEGVPLVTRGCAFNCHSSEGKACYFETASELADLLRGLDPETAARIGADMREIAQRRYTWDHIGKAYFELLDRA